MNATVKEVRNDCVEIAWEPAEGAEKYHVYWADKDISTMKYQLVGDTKECSFVLKKATHVPHYLKVAAVKNETEYEMSNLVETPLKAVFHEQLEKLNRGLIAVKTDEGVYVGWRMFIDEVRGYSDTGLTGLIMPYTAVKTKLQSLQTALTTLIQMEPCRIHIVLHRLLTAKRENAVRKFLCGKTITLIFQ